MQQLHIDWATLVRSKETQTIFLIAVLVFGCCILGILTRPDNHMAYFWPVNAVLLSFFLRFPQYNVPAGWIGAIIGYMWADLMIGTSFHLSAALTLANLVTVSSALMLIQYFKINYRYYDKGFTFLKLAAICGVAGLMGAFFAVSTIPYLPNSFMSADRLGIELGMWWSGEIVNCVILIPLIMTCPKFKAVKYAIHNRRNERIHPLKLLPLVAILFSLVVTTLIPGPGSMLYPLAAMIWAALTYKLFSISVINLAIFLIASQSLMGYMLTEITDAYLSDAISIRIGISMLVLAPLIVCVISRNRQRLFKEILYLANHDSLTHTINRRYFFEAAEAFLLQNPKNPFALLMLDIDFFKKINDRYGHHVGDHVLQHFSNIVSKNMRDHDLFARVGGEEFIVLLSNTDEVEALDIAERIRASIAETPLRLPHHDDIYLTVSIGVTLQQSAAPHQLKDYMIIADFALYSAKSKGRNKVMVAA